VKNIRTSGVTDVNVSLLDPTLSTTGRGDYFMITYTGKNAAAATRISFIDIQEQGKYWDVLKEVKCTAYQSIVETGVQECNASTRGAIGRAWNISAVVNASEDANGSGARDGNYSYPAFTDNLGNTAFFAENFPVAGPLYDIKTTYGKKAELMITGQTAASPDFGSTGTYISWKQIDLTKAPSEWYDSDDQFELFWTEKEQGYWVYLNGEATSTISFVAQTNGTNFKLEGTPYAHFNNYFQGTKTSALTRNHLDNFSLTITTAGLTTFGQATTNTDAFEVYATINGFTTAFQRDGASNDFVVSLDSHETAGIGFDEGEMEITVTLAEASGQVTSSTYTLDYQKPIISSSALVGSTINLTMADTDSSEVHVYSGDINDSNYGTSQATNWAAKATVTANPIPVNLGALGIVFPNSISVTDYKNETQYDVAAEQLSAGIVTDIRLTVLDTAGLYSDQEKFAYIPFYAGTGILSSSSSTTYDSDPVVYTSTGALDSAYTGTTGGIDDGVQLKSSSTASFTCAYYHENVTLDTQTANVREIVLADGTLLGTIMYMDDYVDHPFICSTASGALYVGAFLNDPDINTGGNAVAKSYNIIVNQISGVSVTLAK
jgi:hypothetical protein